LQELSAKLQMESNGCFETTHFKTAVFMTWRQKKAGETFPQGIRYFLDIPQTGHI